MEQRRLTAHLPVAVGLTCCSGSLSTQWAETWNTAVCPLTLNPGPTDRQFWSQGAGLEPLPCDLGAYVTCVLNSTKSMSPWAFTKAIGTDCSQHFNVNMYVCQVCICMQCMHACMRACMYYTCTHARIYTCLHIVYVYTYMQ